MFSLQRFSLQRILGRGDKFFELLEASAEEARQSVQALLALIRAPQADWDLEQVIMRKREEKRITEEITTLLCSTFVTPLEREDIEELSSALSRIPKVVKKFAERLALSQAYVRPEKFSRQAELLEQAIDTVCEMVGQLRHGPRLDTTQEANSRLHQYEGEADKLIVDLWRDLYSGRHDAVQMIVLRDLFELLEKVIDRCRDAGNVIFQIVLKNS